MDVHTDGQAHRRTGLKQEAPRSFDCGTEQTPYTPFGVTESKDKYQQAPKRGQ